MIGLAFQYGGQVLQDISRQTAIVDNNEPAHHQIAKIGIFLLISSLVIAMFVVILVVSHWLWNNILVKYITILRPVDSIVEFILLMVAISWFFTERCDSLNKQFPNQASKSGF